MDIETRQRIAYLIEHGGLWERADNRSHRLILALLGVIIAMQCVLVARVL